MDSPVSTRWSMWYVCSKCRIWLTHHSVVPDGCFRCGEPTTGTKKIGIQTLMLIATPKGALSVKSVLYKEHDNKPWVPDSKPQTQVLNRTNYKEYGTPKPKPVSPF